MSCIDRETSVCETAQTCRSGSHCLVWRNKRFVSSNYKANPLAARRRERFSFRSVFANLMCSQHAVKFREVVVLFACSATWNDFCPGCSPSGLHYNRIQLVAAVIAELVTALFRSLFQQTTCPKHPSWRILFSPKCAPLECASKIFSPRNT